MVKVERNRTTPKGKAGGKPAAAASSKSKPAKVKAKPAPAKSVPKAARIVKKPEVKPADGAKATNGASAPKRSATPSPLSLAKSGAGVTRSAISAPATPPPVPKSGKSMAKKARAELSTIVLPTGYRPSDDEPFMNPRQRVYFRNKLQTWKDDIIKQNRETLQVLHDDTLQHADLADRATSETERALELRARDRQRKLIAKIDAALARIEDGSYGYCEETGEPISLKRLDARPIATLSLEAQERHERRERVYRED